MKTKNLSVLAITSISLAASGQAIPNFSFENWTSMGNYSNPENWGTLNSTTSASGVFTVTQGTPGNPGTYYMKVTSKTVLTTVVPGIAVSGVLDSMTMQPKSGFAFNQRPVNLEGQYQYMSFGGSPGSITVTLTRWNALAGQRETVATGSQTLAGMVMSWSNFSINLMYQTGNNPDTCIIVLAASGANPEDNDYLWVDNLSFSGTVAGIDTPGSFLNDFSTYPNPANELVTISFHAENQTDMNIQLVDLAGKIVKQRNLSTIEGENSVSLNTEGVQSGVYFIRLVSDKGILTRKLIIH
ncbi:MAG: T9SS type A sorting domain-containing protein [Bacteroidota bacterium]|nr:T9SS type A sorting domain-containing protein [Bacteroidota bacterium]